jgi:hypothetical protein
MRLRISGSFIGFVGAEILFGGAFAAFDAGGAAITARVSAAIEATLRVAKMSVIENPRSAFQWFPTSLRREWRPGAYH